MKAEELIQALSEVDDKYIEEAVSYRRSVSKMKIWRIVAIAACACLAASLVFTAVRLNSGYGSYSSKSTSNSLYYSDYEQETAAAAYGDRYEPAVVAEDVFYEMDMEPEEEFLDYDLPVYMAGAAAESDNGTLWSSAADDTAGTPETSDLQARIIYSVYMNLQTRDFDTAIADMEALIRENAGYTENQYISNYSGSYRSANYVIRIPAEHLDAFLNQMGDLCTVIYINRSADDVSESYYDTESRLTTAKTKLARLQELLSQAEDMEDIITIESAISETEWLIDSYSNTLRYYDSHVSYSTVTVNLDEVYEVVVDEAPASFGDKVSQSFHQGLRGFGNFLKNAVIWFANSWIVLMIIAAVIVTVCLVIRHVRRKRHSG